LLWRQSPHRYVIVACSFLVYLLLGESYYNLGVLAPAMARDLGWSATEFGAAITLYMLAVALGYLAGGLFIRHYGPRLVVIIGSLVAAGTCALASSVSSLWVFYAVAVVYGLGTCVGGFLAPMQFISNWFEKRRALFLGIVLSGTGFGGLIVVPALGNLAAAVGGWRLAWQLLAVLSFLPAVVAVLFLRNKPEGLGLRADGVAADYALERNAPTNEQVDSLPGSRHDVKMTAALRLPAFWFLVLAAVGMIFGLTTTASSQVAYLSGEGGMDARLAATALGLMVGMSIVGRLVGGWIGGRVEPRLAAAAFLLVQALSVVLLVSVHTTFAVYVYIALFGISYAANITLFPVIATNYFGVREFAAIYGAALTIANLLAAIGPVIAGILKDATGSYTPAFLLIVVVAVVGALCAFLARPPLSAPTAVRSSGMTERTPVGPKTIEQ
jgi:sugar phosphate permease